MIRILVAEDNLDLSRLFCMSLSNAGYVAYPAYDGEMAVDLFYEKQIDLVITDIMMPKLDGYGLAKELRRENSNLPILFVTARSDYDSLRMGFSSGADDYMVKPGDIKELLLRVQALLRRAKINQEKKIVIGSTTVDSETLSVSTPQETIYLPLKEFELLFKLLSYPGKIFTRQQLMDEIWGYDSSSDDRTINTHINRLREKFEGNPDFRIDTIRGLGYKAVKK